ncbi:MAG: chromosomal replication initiator protein DnaA [Chlamydiota bacterium]
MEAWERFLSTLEPELGKETIERWLRPLRVVDYDACNLYLEAKDAFQMTWFEEQMRKRVQKEFVNNNHRPIHIHLTATSVAPVQKKQKKDIEIAPLPLSFASDPLDPHATLDHFIAGKSNEIAFKLICNLAQGIEKAGTFNPVYIQGSAGTGKTHLLMGIAKELNTQKISTVYVRAETFTEHVVNAIRSGVMRAFRDAYRHADVLLIDDVHLFARKAATQEELFHTFNALHTSGRQIFLSGDKAPQFLEEIEPRLISRFEWGIIIPLEKLTPLELAEMITERCKSLEFKLDKKIISFLISHFQGSTKSLHRALEALILRSHLNKTELRSVQEAEKLLGDLLQIEKISALTPEKIVRATSDYYQIRPTDILGKAQSHDCTLPRQIAMYLCRKELKLPFLKIAALFKRDHSTVMTSVKHIQQKLDENDKGTRFSLSEIERQLTSMTN